MQGAGYTEKQETRDRWSDMIDRIFRIRASKKAVQDARERKRNNGDRDTVRDSRCMGRGGKKRQMGSAEWESGR